MHPKVLPPILSSLSLYHAFLPFIQGHVWKDRICPNFKEFGNPKDKNFILFLNHCLTGLIIGLKINRKQLILKKKIMTFECYYYFFHDHYFFYDYRASTPSQLSLSFLTLLHYLLSFFLSFGLPPPSTSARALLLAILISYHHNSHKVSFA